MCGMITIPILKYQLLSLSDISIIRTRSSETISPLVSHLHPILNPHDYPRNALPQHLHPNPPPPPHKNRQQKTPPTPLPLLPLPKTNPKTQIQNQSQIQTHPRPPPPSRHRLARAHQSPNPHVLPLLLRDGREGYPSLFPLAWADGAAEPAAALCGC